MIVKCDCPGCRHQSPLRRPCRSIKSLLSRNRRASTHCQHMSHSNSALDSKPIRRLLQWCKYRHVARTRCAFNVMFSALQTKCTRFVHSLSVNRSFRPRWTLVRNLDEPSTVAYAAVVHSHMKLLAHRHHFLCDPSRSLELCTCCLIANGSAK